MATDTELLNMLYSGVTTAVDFHYDQLQAPPLLSLLTIYDIDELRKIATSVALSGNVDKKYKMINNIMKPRGFVKLAAGTNRVVYRHPELPNIVVKIAVDNVGMGDNPDEFYNQQFIKPFCCKVFEVSPCGTVGVFERVERITSKYEFVSIAEDIFDIIVNKLVGKYVLNDIGAKFMYNWGVRRGFGPVILDFPYLYELDGDKLLCNQRMDDGSICCGDIDYDDQFNFLVCKKCGRVYSALELSKPHKDRGIFVRSKGGTEMKVSLMRGNTVIRTTDTKDMYDIMRKNVAVDQNVSTIKGRSVGDKQVTNANDIKTTPSFVLKRGKETVFSSDNDDVFVEKKNTSDFGSFSVVRISEEEERKQKNKQDFNAFATMNGIVTADKKDNTSVSVVRGDVESKQEEVESVKEETVAEVKEVVEETKNVRSIDDMTDEEILQYLKSKNSSVLNIESASMPVDKEEIPVDEVSNEDDSKQEEESSKEITDDAAKALDALTQLYQNADNQYSEEKQEDVESKYSEDSNDMSTDVDKISEDAPTENQLISPVEFLDTTEQESEEKKDNDLKLSIAMKNRNRLKTRPVYGKKEG